MKIISSNDVGSVIPDGAVIYACGFGLGGFAEEVAIGIEQSFIKTGHPNQLTLYSPTSLGNRGETGYHHFAHSGLLKRVVGGHYELGGKRLNDMILHHEFEVYNFPQGVLSQLPANIAAKRPGLITKVGLGTFVDPRLEGGKITDKAKEDLVEVMELDGQEWLYYKAPKVQVGLIRGSVADEEGNLTFEREGVILEALEIAQAARNCGGIVIAQVEHIAKKGTFHPKQVKVPGFLVDYVVVAKPENHLQTMCTYYNPAFSGDVKVPVSSLKPLPLDERKVIARRAALELMPGSVVNLGIGMPEGVSAVASEEGIAHFMTLTTEAGAIGGVPAGGLDFGHSANLTATITQPNQFAFYDGGGIDVAFLGLAQADEQGNINVSKFGPKVAGCGGFIDISQNAKKVIYCGTFTAGHLKLAVGEGRLKILQEGQYKKFIRHVEQVTFSGSFAAQQGQYVLYVTERAVFKLTTDGLELIEIAPGIDLEKDILAHMEFEPIIRSLKLMDEKLFQEQWGGFAFMLNDSYRTAG